MLYIIWKCNGIDKYRFSKIFYFANRDHLARYGRDIVNAHFKAFEFGPVPDIYYSTFEGYSKYIPEGIKEFLEASVKQVEHSIIIAEEKPDLDFLSKSDMECLDKSISEYKNYSFEELKNLSHDSAWTSARQKNGDKALMDSLEIAKAGGASAEMIEYIAEQKELELICNQYASRV